MIADYISGIAGGITVVLIGHPFDTIKTRLQTSPTGFYEGTVDCVKKTLKWEGLKGFYSGIYSPLAGTLISDLNSLLILGQMIFRSVSFGTYYNTGRFMLSQSGSNELSPHQLLLCGGITGFVISFVEVLSILR